MLNGMLRQARALRIGAFVSIAVLMTACSVGGQQSFEHRSHAAFAGSIEAPRAFASMPGARGPFLYACNVACVWFKVGVNRVIGQLPAQQPTGIGVDPVNGDVYVSTRAGVQVYAPDSTQVINSLTDPMQVPGSIAVDRHGTVFVVNSEDTSSGPGSISVYPAGATTPARYIRDSSVQTGLTVAVDEHDLLVFCFINASNLNECDEFQHARGVGHELITGIVANGVSFDNAEKLVVMDSAAVAADTYSASTMCGSLALLGPQTFQNLFAMALSRDNTKLYANATFINAVADVQVGEYAYSDCASGVESPGFLYDTGFLPFEMTGVAVVPAALP